MSNLTPLEREQALEIRRLKEAVAEMNERLHERTQGFLRRAAADRQELERCWAQLSAVGGLRPVVAPAKEGGV